MSLEDAMTVMPFDGTYMGRQGAESSPYQCVFMMCLGYEDNAVEETVGVWVITFY